MSLLRSKLQAPLYSGPSWWQAALALAIALLLQVEVMPYAKFRGAVPSLVLVVVVWFSLRSTMSRAVLFGLVAGLAEDLLGGSTTGARTGGAFTVATTFVALAISAASQRFFADSILIVSAITAAATLLQRLLYWSVMSLEGYPRGFARVNLHQSVWEALLNALLMAILFLIFRALLRPGYR